MPTPDVDSLVSGWVSHFWAADHSLTWHWAELEHSLWLTPNTLLVGRMDAGGENENGLFFGEWKTANPRERNTWKQIWRMNPQSLTYGVLANDYFMAKMGRGCSQFTVRKAFKSSPATYDYAWYSYSEAELDHWKRELITIAHEMRNAPLVGNWPVNWDSCFKYGINYACPHFEEGCSKMNWDVPVDAVRRVSHLEIERRLNDSKEANAGFFIPGEEGEPIHSWSDVVVLDATRVKTWLTCRERFRREYIENVAVPVDPGSSLEIGIAFHEGVGRHYQTLASLKAGGVTDTGPYKFAMNAGPHNE